MTGWWWLLAGVRVITEGETIESVAASLGSPELADAIRALNQVDPGMQPAVGTVLELPPGTVGADCQPSYVRRLNGSGRLWEPRQGVYVPLQERQALEVESRVCTDADSWATLRLSVDMHSGAYDEIVLMPSSCVWIQGAWGAGTDRTSLVRLTEGSLSVASSARASEVAVVTEAGLTVGDGGGFRVVIEPSATRTEALYREVLTLAQGVQVAVPSGHGNRTPVGERPGAAVRLPPPPSALFRPADGSVLGALDFGWSTVEVGVGYQLEVALDPAFEQVVFRTPTLTPQYPDVAPTADAIQHLAVPVRSGPWFWWRVSTVDRLEFEGPPGEAWSLRFPEPMLVRVAEAAAP